MELVLLHLLLFLSALLRGYCSSRFLQPLGIWKTGLPSMRNYTPLSSQQLRELATLASAGVSIAEAWEKSSAKDHLAGNSVLALLKRGRSLSEALFQFGLLSPSQKIVLAAAENCGELSAALLRFATDNENRAAHKKLLSSKMRSAYLLLLVGWGSGMIANGVADPDSIGSLFLLNTAKCLVAYWILRQLLKMGLQDAWWWFRLVWKYGGRGSSNYQYAFIIHWLGLLGSQLRAGIDASTALTAMQGLIPVPAYRAAITNAACDTEKGRPLSVSLAQNDLLPNQELEQVFSAAEASGKIADNIKHQSLLAQQKLDLNIASFIFWSPKLAYVFCAVVASSMVFF